MAEYIERELILKKFCERCNEEMSDSPCEPNDCFAMNIIKGFQAADVSPVRHGRWEFRRSEKHKFNIDAVCTACNTAVDSHPENNLDHRQTSIKKKLPYCPNCGARMDLEV